MITGGYDEETADTDDGRVIIQFAKRLAEQVVLQKHQLRCGNVSSLDALIIDAACDAAEKKGLDPGKIVVSYHPKGKPPRTSRGGVSGSAIGHWNLMDGRKLAVPEPISQADVLILLGGYGDASGRRRPTGLVRPVRRSCRWRPSAWPRATFLTTCRIPREDQDHRLEPGRSPGSDEVKSGAHHRPGHPAVRRVSCLAGGEGGLVP